MVLDPPSLGWELGAVEGDHLCLCSSHLEVERAVVEPDAAAIVHAAGHERPARDDDRVDDVHRGFTSSDDPSHERLARLCGDGRSPRGAYRRDDRRRRSSARHIHGDAPCDEQAGTDPDDHQGRFEARAWHPRRRCRSAKSVCAESACASSVCDGCCADRASLCLRAGPPMPTGWTSKRRSCRRTL